MVVTGEPELLRELDIALWTFSPLDFVPHCHGGAGAPARAGGLARGAGGLRPRRAAPAGAGEPGRGGARRLRALRAADRGRDRRTRTTGSRPAQRWKHYADRGYAITRHDRAQGGQLMANRTPPRYVPTLTEVVQADAPAPPAAAAGRRCRRSSSLHRVMQRVDLALERRLREAIASTVLEQTRSLAPLLRDADRVGRARDRGAGVRRRDCGASTRRRAERCELRSCISAARDWGIPPYRPHLDLSLWFGCGNCDMFAAR